MLKYLQYIYIYVCVALSNAEPDKMLLIKKKKDAVIIIKQSPINASMSCIYIYIVVVVVIIYYCCYSVVWLGNMSKEEITTTKAKC